MGVSHRASRVRESLYREFSDIVRNLRDPRIRSATVVDAEVSRDLKHARMFVSVLGSEEEKKEAVAALENALGHIRREIAQRISMRQIPEVSVAYDDTSERASRLTALIETAVSTTGSASSGDEGQSRHSCH
jgi:ribosome-binding factor A